MANTGYGAITVQQKNIWAQEIQTQIEMAKMESQTKAAGQVSVKTPVYSMRVSFPVNGGIVFDLDGELYVATEDNIGEVMIMMIAKKKLTT